MRMKKIWIIGRTTCIGAFVAALNSISIKTFGDLSLGFLGSADEYNIEVTNRHPKYNL